MWVEIFFKGEKVADSYSDKDTIRISCDLLNSRPGINFDDIETIVRKADK